MKKEIFDKMSTLITSAFGLVAALSWNSAIQSIFSTYYQRPGDDIPSQVIYAGTVTLVAVLITVWFTKYGKKTDQKDEALKKKLNAANRKIKNLKAKNIAVNADTKKQLH